jgi:copper chaperone
MTLDTVKPRSIPMTIAFEVNDMTCGHCVSTITKAVKAADPNARVAVDLAHHLVQIEPFDSDAQELADAIQEAGYSPVPARSTGPLAGPAPKAGGGCCCG